MKTMPISDVIRKQAVELRLERRDLLTAVDQQKQFLVNHWLFVTRPCWVCTFEINAADAGDEQFSFEGIVNHYTCPRCQAPLMDGVPSSTTQPLFWHRPRDFSDSMHVACLRRAADAIYDSADVIEERYTGVYPAAHL